MIWTVVARRASANGAFRDWALAADRPLAGRGKVDFGKQRPRREEVQHEVGTFTQAPPKAVWPDAP